MDSSPRWLRGLLLLVVVAPALAFAWGRVDGEIAFVLFREPKLITVAVLGWVFLAAFAWTCRAHLSAAALPETLQHPALLALAAFLGYLTLTGLWVRVPQNYFYELNQYVLLLALLVTLLVWHRSDTTVPALVRYGLVASLAAVTAVGALQAAVPLPFLSPIEPEIGARHPSFMGYKNPAALALLGQVFLLAQLVFDGGRTTRYRLFWGLILLGELIYLASLGSRTSYAALLVASVFLVVLSLLRQPSCIRTFRTLGAAAALFLLVAVSIGMHRASREKALSLVSLALHPQTYLASDRGTYLRNTLHMARHHPLGVGLGDWQTHYPVFRKYNRTTSFSPQFQVRRAHSDHVQFLGEGGWPGFVLWLTFLCVLLLKTSRHYLETGREASLFAATQLVAIAAAMATDYLLEIPYHKFQFFLVVFLALATEVGPCAKHAVTVSGSRRSGRTLVVALALTAAVQLVYHASLAHKVCTAAEMEHMYVRAAGKPQDHRRMTALGLELAGLAGHTKSLHKHYLLLAHSAYLGGRKDLALAAARKSLELHPYHPNSFRLLAALVDDPQAADRWRAAYDHVMDEATHGFDAEYPRLPP